MRMPESRQQKKLLLQYLPLQLYWLRRQLILWRFAVTGGSGRYLNVSGEMRVLKETVERARITLDIQGWRHPHIRSQHERSHL